MTLNRRTPLTFVALAALSFALVFGATASAAGVQATSTQSHSTQPGQNWRDTATVWQKPAGGHSRIMGLRHAQHARFDRVVIDLRGPIPDWSTRYLRIFHYEGSGKRVPIHGRSGLVMSLGADAHTHSGRNLFTGPKIARPGYQSLKALALTGDLEGQVTFSFALRHRAPYRVIVLHHPQRLVLDFKR